MFKRRTPLASVALAAGIFAGAALAAAPSFTVYPSISQDGRYLMGDVGQWVNADTITYRWERCDPMGLTPCVTITEATGLVYKLNPSRDYGKRIGFAINAVGPDGQSSAAANVDCLTHQSLHGTRDLCQVQP